MDGVLPFLKPPGITSHDAVAICRRILKEKRIGHSGTLDPMAYGVLPVFLGKATRLIEYTDGFDKPMWQNVNLGLLQILKIVQVNQYCLIMTWYCEMVFY